MDRISKSGLFILMLISLPVKGQNVNCDGKAFYCVNSTHFKICVDLGGGVSKTVDDFMIPCPSNTFCKESNQYECEFQINPPPLEQQRKLTIEATTSDVIFNDNTGIIPLSSNKNELSERYYNTLNITPEYSTEATNTETTHESLLLSITKSDTTEQNSKISENPSQKVDINNLITSTGNINEHTSTSLNITNGNIPTENTISTTPEYVTEATNTVTMYGINDTTEKKRDTIENLPKNQDLNRFINSTENINKNLVSSNISDLNIITENTINTTLEHVTEATNNTTGQQRATIESLPQNVNLKHFITSTENTISTTPYVTGVINAVTTLESSLLLITKANTAEQKRTILQNQSQNQDLEDFITSTENINENPISSVKNSDGNIPTEDTINSTPEYVTEVTLIETMHEASLLFLPKNDNTEQKRVTIKNLAQNKDLKNIIQSKESVNSNTNTLLYINNGNTPLEDTISATPSVTEVINTMTTFESSLFLITNDNTTEQKRTILENLSPNQDLKYFVTSTENINKNPISLVNNSDKNIPTEDSINTTPEYVTEATNTEITYKKLDLKHLIKSTESVNKDTSTSQNINNGKIPTEDTLSTATEYVTGATNTEVPHESSLLSIIKNNITYQKHTTLENLTQNLDVKHFIKSMDIINKNTSTSLNINTENTPTENTLITTSISATPEYVTEATNTVKTLESSLLFINKNDTKEQKRTTNEDLSKDLDLKQVQKSLEDINKNMSTLLNVSDVNVLTVEENNTSDSLYQNNSSSLLVSNNIPIVVSLKHPNNTLLSAFNNVSPERQPPSAVYDQNYSIKNSTLSISNLLSPLVGNDYKLKIENVNNSLSLPLMLNNFNYSTNKPSFSDINILHPTTVNISKNIPDLLVINNSTILTSVNQIRERVSNKNVSLFNDDVDNQVKNSNKNTNTTDNQNMQTVRDLNEMSDKMQTNNSLPLENYNNSILINSKTKNPIKITDPKSFSDSMSTSIIPSNIHTDTIERNVITTPTLLYLGTSIPSVDNLAKINTDAKYADDIETTTSSDYISSSKETVKHFIADNSYQKILVSAIESTTNSMYDQRTTIYNTKSSQYFETEYDTKMPKDRIITEEKKVLTSSTMLSNNGALLTSKSQQKDDISLNITETEDTKVYNSNIKQILPSGIQNINKNVISESIQLITSDYVTPNSQIGVYETQNNKYFDMIAYRNSSELNKDTKISILKQDGTKDSFRKTNSSSVLSKSLDIIKTDTESITQHDQLINDADAETISPLYSSSLGNYIEQKVPQIETTFNSNYIRYSTEPTTVTNFPLNVRSNISSAVSTYEQKKSTTSDIQLGKVVNEKNVSYTKEFTTLPNADYSTNKEPIQISPKIEKVLESSGLNSNYLTFNKTVTKLKMPKANIKGPIILFKSYLTDSTFCIGRLNGRYSDQNNCSKFYMCVGGTAPLVGECPSNTVFSDIKKLCTKNLSHCVRNSQFKCSANGRYYDVFLKNTYYICVWNKNRYIKFKFQCQNGYSLNKTVVQCIPDQKNINSSASEYDSSNIKDGSTSKETNSKAKDNFECEREGKFAVPNSCNKYYVCSMNNKSELRRRIKSCDPDEVWHKEKHKCVDEDSYECKIKSN